jgi:hypothetical protein
MSKGNSPRGPFCWQHKSALRLIREALGGDGTVSTGICVYVALTEIASDKQSAGFTAGRNYISYRCGVEEKTVGKRMHDLRDLGLVDFPDQTGKMKGPYTVTMLFDTETVSSDGKSIPYDGNQHASPTIPILEESKEESKEEAVVEGAEPTTTTHSGSASVGIDDAALDQLQSRYQDKPVRAVYAKLLAHCVAKSYPAPNLAKLEEWVRNERVAPAAPPAAPGKESVWGLKQKLEQVTELIKDIEASHAIQTPHGLVWVDDSDEETKERYERLRKERKALRQQIAGA